MDAYPPEFTNHEFPLIVLSGLTDDSVSPVLRGPTIECNLPIVQSDVAKLLAHDFSSLEESGHEWSPRTARSKKSLISYKFKFVGRSYSFPPRKADPPSPQHVYKENPLADEDPKTPTQWVLHSPLSPLSPESPLYPDGIFAPSWMTKHQDRVPCLFLAFFDFTSNPNLNSLNDNKLKTEISAIRTALQNSEYKTRFAVVLLSDKTILEAPDIEERLATIRRATGLDPKTGIFFLPPSPSRVEITSFVTSLLTTIQPVCIEYYRDLTKHSRRKKNRSNAPAPTLPPTRTTSHPLSSHGWNIRYDIKLGILAEFRQEMDASCRHYTSALEALMGPEGVFETTVSWSPRWDEGRLLADMMAFRIIRCLLWSQLTTTATQSWVNYRDRMHELVDRRGKGSSNYGWEAWESRWAKIMAELIQRADIPAIAVLDSIDMTTSMVLAKSENTTFMPPEKVFVGADRIPPWHHMHHPGYWMRLSARSAKRRLRYANAIPEEDRSPPQQSPASAVAQRSRTYDTYLCPWPHEESSYPAQDGFDHGKDIIERLQMSAQSFNDRKQKRFAERLSLEIGRELLRKQDYKEGVEHLKILWKDCTWRGEKWWLPLFELNRTMAECARQVGDISALTAALFELHAPNLRLLRDMRIDLMDCAKTTKVNETQAEKSTVELSPNSVVSFLNTSFVFSLSEGHVGEAIHGQLKVFSDAHQNTSPVTLSKIRCQFKQNRYEFEISHLSDDEAATDSQDAIPTRNIVEVIDITKNQATQTDEGGLIVFKASTSLTFYPGRRVVFIVAFDIKEPGELELESLISEIETPDFHLIFNAQPIHFERPLEWYINGENEAQCRRRITRDEPWSTEIRPKPPKLDIQVLDLDRSLYTDEPVKVDFEIRNGEEEDVSATLDVRILTRGTPPEIAWIHSEESEPPSDSEGDSPPSRSLNLPSLSPDKSISRTAIFTAPSMPTDLILEYKLHYFLPSDPEVPLSKTFTTSISISSPFEANYEFTARAHPDPWPSYFSVTSPIPGLVQRWNLAASVASFASERITIQKVAFEIEKKPNALECNVITGSIDDGQEINPRTMRNYNFLFDTTRSSAKEHRNMSMSAKFVITWNRTNDDLTLVTSSLLVSPLQLPALEPRIIAMSNESDLSLTPTTSSTPTGIKSSPQSSVTLNLLTLFMENPTAHPLTFDITVPSSESLAFSGPKQRGVTVLPFSRTEVDFRLLPLVRGGIWVTFGVKVVDRYFMRDVEVLPGEGLKATEDGGGIKWWVD